MDGQCPKDSRSFNSMYEIIEVELQFDLPAGTRSESVAVFERIADEAYNCGLV